MNKISASSSIDFKTAKRTQPETVSQCRSLHTAAKNSWWSDSLIDDTLNFLRHTLVAQFFLYNTRKNTDQFTYGQGRSSLIPTDYFLYICICINAFILSVCIYGMIIFISICHNSISKKLLTTSFRVTLSSFKYLIHCLEFCGERVVADRLRWLLFNS